MVLPGQPAPSLLVVILCHGSQRQSTIEELRLQLNQEKSEVANLTATLQQYDARNSRLAAELETTRQEQRVRDHAHHAEIEERESQFDRLRSTLQNELQGAEQGARTSEAEFQRLKAQLAALQVWTAHMMS